MDVEAFVADLLESASLVGCFVRVSLRVDGPVAKGRLDVSSDVFCRFYFNELTQTTAFALVRSVARIWGIDHDARRGWHRHPAADPDQHEAIGPMSVREIIVSAADVLETSPGS